MYSKVFVVSFFIGLFIDGCYLQNETVETDPILTIVQNDGYPIEAYEVTANDGYINGLYRIPPKMSTSKVVFLMHGMIVSAIDFLVLGPHENKALAYALADAGYDVWLGNARGTKFSRKHSTITANDDEYWQFSWNEIGCYDVPAFIDYVLAKTGQKSLHYIGHSQGTTVFFVMLSMLPAYNEKIRSFHGLTPVMGIKYPSPLAQFLAANSDEIEQTAAMFNIVEMPNTAVSEAENVASMFCQDGNPFAHLCASAFFAIYGKSPTEFNGTLVGTILRNVPAGMSLRQLHHYLQLINAKKFQMYDHKSQGNLAKYNSSMPPQYQTSNIRVKMQILYGTHDLIATPQDVEEIIHYFGHLVVDVVKLDEWNHIDVIYGKNANKMVNQKIIEVMKQHQM